MTPEQALSQIETAYAALAELQKADWLHQVHHKIPSDSWNRRHPEDPTTPEDWMEWKEWGWVSEAEILECQEGA